MSGKAQLKPRWDQIREKPDLVLTADLLSALSPQLDITTGIQPSQRVAGAFPQWTGTVWVWSDYSTDSGTWTDSTIWVDANLWSDN